MHPESVATALPLAAILRGVQTARVVEIAGVLFAEGIRFIEVPLNSPDPFTSIAALVAAHGVDCLIGAGTVLDPDKEEVDIEVVIKRHQPVYFGRIEIKFAMRFESAKNAAMAPMSQMSSSEKPWARTFA